MYNAEDILNNIDEIMHIMQPRYCMHPTMDGRYPCWIVWLPKSGKTERKTLKEAIIEFAEDQYQINISTKSELVFDI